jgi:hypothetical protein
MMFCLSCTPHTCRTVYFAQPTFRCHCTKKIQLSVHLASLHLPSGLIVAVADEGTDTQVAEAFRLVGIRTANNSDFFTASLAR